MDLEQLNKATIQHLEEIGGVGGKRARDIVRFREENGDFEDWDDLKRVPGFSDEMIDILRSSGDLWD